MEVSKKLRWLIDDLETTHCGIAKRIGVSPSAFSRWIRGSRIPNAAHLLILAKLYPKLFTHDEVMTWLSKK
jgi:transcriptional regulator with XRE-family HTH domain